MVEHFKQGLLGHPSRRVEDAESNITYDDLAQEISKGKILVNRLETILTIFC